MLQMIQTAAARSNNIQNTPHNPVHLGFSGALGCGFAFSFHSFA